MPSQNLPGLVLDRTHLLARGLVGWWPMNEGGGNRLNNWANPREHALSVATINKQTGSPIGNARGFGTSSYATATVAELPLGSSLRTLAAWMRVPTSGAGDTIPFGYGPQSFNAQCTFYVDSANHMLVQIYGTALQVNYTPDNRWHFFAAVMTGTTISTCRLYIDGANYAGTLTGPDSILAATSTSLTFGANPGNTTQNVFPGSLANVRLYNRALDAREVAQIYADPMAGALARPSPNRYWTPPVFKPAWASRSSQVIGGSG